MDMRQSSGRGTNVGGLTVNKSVEDVRDKERNVQTTTFLSRIALLAISVE